MSSENHQKFITFFKLSNVKMLKLNLHSLAYPVTALGTGKRVVLWVSGCSLNCKGCISPELQPPESGKDIKIESVVKHLLTLPVELEGITLSGGEPFEQAEALAALLIALKPSRPEWNVLVFSGYPLAYLRRDDTDLEKTKDLLAQVDILVDAPYLEQSQGQHPLTASSNQRVHYLTQRGAALSKACESLSMNHANLGIGTAPTQRLIGIIREPERVKIHQQFNLKHPS